MPIAERAITVPPGLRLWISDMSVAVIRGHDGPVVDLPDHATTLALRVTPGHHSDLMVMGPRTRALYHQGEPGPFCVKARIQPGLASAVLGRPAAGVLNRIVPLSELWGEDGERLAHALGDISQDPAAAGPPSLSRLLHDALAGQWSSRKPDELARSHLAHQAAVLLSTGPAATAEPVAVTAGRLHWSERHLRNVFTESVGLSPKRFAGLDRVRAALERASTGPWPAPAAELGYYDQSHMAAEFRRVMGIPPNAFVKGRLPQPSYCASSAKFT